MLIFVDAKLAMFAVPKTGTTAYHAALKGKADIVFSGKPGYKHMPVRKYERHFAPFLKNAYGLVPERVAVMRDPVEQIRSWYKYRNRPATPAANKVPVGLSFDQFVGDVISEDPPAYANFGNQFQFLTNKDGGLGMDHLFAYAHLPKYKRFLAQRLNKVVEPEQHNVSPKIDAPLSSDMEAKLRKARPEEFALYDLLLAADGYLKTRQR